MADQPEDDELLLEDEAEDESEVDENEEEQGSEEAGEQADDELEVTFGDEAAPASGERETGLVKHLRDEIRRRDLELAEARKNQPQPQKIEVGPEPTLEGCEWDETRFRTETRAWLKRQEEAEQAESQTQKVAREAQEAWQKELADHEAKRAGLKFADVQEAEEVAMSTLDQVQQAVIVKVAENSALVLYSLGKHPAKLAELSHIKDPLKLAAAVAKLEGTLKVTSRRKAPDPEEIASGSARVTQGKDKELERLEKEASRTGDRTKLVAYKKKLNAQAAK